MKKDYLFNIAKNTFDDCLETMEAKNHDYSSGAEHGDALRNFKICEFMGFSKTGEGILVRITDKIARLGNLLSRPAKVKSESMLDTIDDAINYLILLKAVLIEQEEDK